MFKKTIVLTLSTLLLTTTITGCAKYNARSIPTAVAASREMKNKDGISIAVKFLSSSESRSIFTRTSVYGKFSPAIVTVYNQTDHDIEFRKDQMGVPVIPGDQVARECEFNTAGRATAYGVGGLILWPLLIPAVVDGMGSSKANEKMLDDFSSKELADRTLRPGEKIHWVVFFQKMQAGQDLTVSIYHVSEKTFTEFSFNR